MRVLGALLLLCSLMSHCTHSVPVGNEETPHFIVSLPDGNLLCFNIDGYELFTYNLLTSPSLTVNAFLNATRLESGEVVRGHTDVGFIIKTVDRRVAKGTRLFKNVVYGDKKKAVLDGFGEVDITDGAMTFSVSEGHSNIESEQSKHEQFRIILDQPKVDLRAVSSDGMFFNIYVNDASGLLDAPVNGLIGQFLSSGVSVDTAKKLLQVPKRTDPIPVLKAPVWDTVEDKEYRGRHCWYPTNGTSVLEGMSYDYIIEHILSTKFKFSEFVSS